MARGFAVFDARGVLAGVDDDAERFDARAQQPAAAFVDLHGHEPWCELDDIGREAEILERLRGFETEQSAADDDAARGVRARVADRFEVFDRAIDEDSRTFASRDRRHERRGAGREHQDVVFVFRAALRRDALVDAIDRGDRIARVQLDTVRIEELARRQREIFDARAREEFGEVDAVVREPRFFREHGDREVATLLRQRFEKALTDHAVAYDDDSLLHGSPALVR